MRANKMRHAMAAKCPKLVTMRKPDEAENADETGMVLIYRNDSF
jgi:hypothetical protein